MATESLIIELDAKTAKLDAGLKKTEDRLAILEDKTKKTDKGFKDFGKRAQSVGVGLAKVGAVVLAVNAALTAMVLGAANGRKELENFARQAKTSTADFQALSFATSQYGINAEKIADISKDISDKVGEFAAAGTGTFQDYADVMKLTKDEARTLAIEFQSLSSEEVIGKMVSEMEAAGTSGSQMIFVLESMGSDLSKLLPLYKGNSKELLTLKKRFDDVNKSLQITDVQADKLKEVSTAYSLMTSQLGNAATAISATLAPVMDNFFNDVISVVPHATQTIIDFANSFLDAKHIFKESDLTTQLEASQIRLLELTAKKALMEKNSNTNLRDSGASRVVQIQQLKDSIEFERKRTADLNEQLKVVKALEDAKKLDDAKSIGGGSIDGLGGLAQTGGVGTGDEIKEIADRFKTEEELLTEKLERELVLIGEHNINKAQLEADFIASMADATGVDEEELLTEKYELELEKIAEHNQLKLDLQERYIEDLSDIEESADKTDQDFKDDSFKKKEKKEKKSNQIIEDSKSKNVGNMLSIADSLVGGNEKIGKAIFLAQKALGISDVFIQTERAAARALAELGPVAGPPAAAAIKTSGYISMGAIAASALGSVSSSGSSSVSSNNNNNTGNSNAVQRETFDAESTGLDITEQGLSTQTIRFAVDSGDDLIDAISNALNKANSEGR